MTCVSQLTSRDNNSVRFELLVMVDDVAEKDEWIQCINTFHQCLHPSKKDEAVSSSLYLVETVDIALVKHLGECVLPAIRNHGAVRLIGLSRLAQR
jgi:hypothetical protein